jgi:hypothetical protein
VVCGTPLCESCRKGPRHSTLCEAHSGVHLVSGWAEVHRAASELEAMLAAGILRGARIDARVLSQKDRANVVTFGGLSVVRVLVPAFMYEDAVSVIRVEYVDGAG